jgi:hypothetical protein
VKWRVLPLPAAGSHSVGGRSSPPSDTITQREIHFRSLPIPAAGYQVDATESAVSEVKLAGSWTPTSFS